MFNEVEVMAADRYGRNGRRGPPLARIAVPVLFDIAVLLEAHATL